MDRNRLRAISIEDRRVEALVVEGLVFDERTDIALFSVALQNDESANYFPSEFSIDSSIPAIGSLVGVTSYYGMETFDHYQSSPQNSGFKLKLQPQMRVGRVLAYHPNGHRLCRGPCIETSIPVFSGMSGGPVIHYGTEGAIKPLGLVCSDPDLDDENKMDRSLQGRSIFALLPCEVIGREGTETTVKFSLPDIRPENVAGTLWIPEM